MAIPSGPRSDVRRDPAAFIRTNTALLRPPLVPEIALHLASDAVPLWRATEEELAASGLERLIAHGVKSSRELEDCDLPNAVVWRVADR